MSKRGRGREKGGREGRRLVGWVYVSKNPIVSRRTQKELPFTVNPQASAFLAAELTPPALTLHSIHICSSFVELEKIPMNRDHRV